MESRHFLAISSLWQKLQNFFFDFWFTPPKARNLLPKICIKSPISRRVRQIDRRCLGLIGSFRGWPIQWNHVKCCVADPCCHGNEFWAFHGNEFWAFFFKKSTPLLLLFVCRWNLAIFWPSVLNVALYKTLFLDFWFRPHTAQNLLPKICTKSPITRLVWQIDRICLHLPGGIRRWPIQRNHAKCCGADRCCHGNDIWARRGDLVAYRLVTYLLPSTGKWFWDLFSTFTWQNCSSWVGFCCGWLRDIVYSAVE